MTRPAPSALLWIDGKLSDASGRSGIDSRSDKSESAPLCAADRTAGACAASATDGAVETLSSGGRADTPARRPATGRVSAAAAGGNPIDRGSSSVLEAAAEGYCEPSFFCTCLTVTCSISRDTSRST
eukprot:scaffold263758_cov36-Tisochrysis_lutea.AAC.2